MTDVIKHMRDRFLAWRLPEDFAPDGGIEFSQRGPHGPTGTNLFTAVQAEAMIRHMLECAPAASQPVAEIHRSFPDAADGRPMSPMGDALMTAGLNIEDARFVAIQLARNGLAMVPTPAPVVPAEGLDAEHLVAAWLDETEVFATRRERLMDDVLAECDLAPWLHAACQVGIDAALRAHQPAAPVSGVTVREAGWRPIETAPHEELVVLGWQEDGVWKQEIALASAGKRLPNGYSNRWMHGRATHWMPLPEPPVFSALEGK